MNREVGWILDTYVQNEKAVIWLRSERGKALKLIDSYSPRFYIRTRNEEGGRTLFQRLQDLPHVKGIVFVEKYTVLGDDKRRKLLCVTLDGISKYKQLVTAIESSPHVKVLYNTDLLHVQRYLFTKLRVAPMSKVEIEYDAQQKINSVEPVDDSKDVAIPPFTVLLFDVHADPSFLPPDPQRDPITTLEVKCGSEEEVLRGGEQVILEQFASLVKGYDPEFLICPQSRKTINYLFERVRRLKLDLRFGRDGRSCERITRPIPYGLLGRVVLDYEYYESYGIAGLVERTRFSFLPPGIASRWTANRIIDSRNCYELLKRGYVIPKNTGYYKYVRTVAEAVDRDRGGLIFAPKIGMMYENVAELDFESQYPHLIVHDGLSYETLTPQGLIARDDALLPHVTRQFLDRRLWFKRLRKTYDKRSQERRWCEQRQLALKMILVCLYGTSGCCWNRFGNVRCFEEINRRSREILVKTKNFVQQRGFEAVYADTDSIFVKEKGATKEDYNGLCGEIHQHVGLPIALDHHYKYLLFLPLESDPSGNTGAQKHYFGILTNGELVTRGIETRRHDCPPFIKKFQNKLIQTLFDAKTSDEVYGVGYRNAVNFIDETIDKLMNREVSPTELVISKILRKPLSERVRMFPHVSAAVNLSQQGKAIKGGDVVGFVYVNARHRNPLRRVAPIEIYDSEYYDREKYRALVLDAAETVLSTFGFSRRQFEVG